MPILSRSKYLLSAALVLGLCADNVPAQESGMIPPPIPAVLPEPPPDPDTLPPPPQLEWESLGPKGSEEEAGAPAVSYVPPPEPEASIPLPPPPVVETPLAVQPDPAEMEWAKPEVEIWREESESPQVPERHFNQLEQAYITGTEPVALRVQFDPRAAGKRVLVRPGRGMTLNPAVVFLTVSAIGECILSAQLAEGLARSHIIFYCAGVKTILPVVRASLAIVEQAELGGGQ